MTTLLILIGAVTVGLWLYRRLFPTDRQPMSVTCPSCATTFDAPEARDRS